MMKQANRLLALFCLALILTIGFRAFSLSMTTDEAFTVCHYAAHGENIYSAEQFWPNNHILHSILVWAMFQAAPWQEWAMRLPAVLAGIGVVLILCRLGKTLFETDDAKSPLCTVLLVAVVVLHPLVFQFLSFARGYGMSLFFSLAGFYCLLLIIEKKDGTTGHCAAFRSRLLFLIGGILFGLSVASNLTAAVMNTSLIAVSLAVAIFRGAFQLRDFVPFAACFCLPGAAIVLLLYAPVLLHVPLGQFSYAAETPWEGLLDPIAYTLGRCDSVPVENVARFFIGIPVSEETYWLILAAAPFVFVLPVFIGALAVALRTMSKKQPWSQADTALPIILGGLIFYAAILCIGWSFGKNLFPKDRTGVLPIAYASMLPVLLLHQFGTSKTVGRIMATVLLLYLVHLTALFSRPYYHNIWYADAEIRRMMQDVQKRMDEPDPPKTLVCLAMNEATIDYYVKKYGLDDLRTERILQTDAVENISSWPDRTFFILPAHEAEAPVRRQSKSLEIIRRNSHTGLVLMESRR